MPMDDPCVRLRGTYYLKVKQQSIDFMTSLRLAFLILCLSTQFALASSTNIKVFGHDLEISSKVKGDGEVLTIDKKQLLKDQYIAIREIGSFGSTGFVIGDTGPGGNACNGSLFVLSFTANEPTRIDGPLATCGPVQYKIEKERIIVETHATPNLDGARWTWTANGFGPPEILKFVPVGGTGWNELRSRSIQHPSELLQHAEFSEKITKLLGLQYPTFTRVVDGPGSVRYESNVMIGTACQSHSCDDTSLLIAVDIASQKVAIALKDGNKLPIVLPRDANWPDAAKADLRRWRTRWSH